MTRLLMAALALLAANTVQAQTTLRYGMNLPPGDNSDCKAELAFKECVEFSIAGRLKIQISGGGQVGCSGALPLAAKT